uniref:Leucine-rich repeat-containing N-terminal plant-type domain-containing protein n=1 Tax=Oryza punctata TaxID=4537 RepID=A0A0E0MGE8_ORYPU
MSSNNITGPIPDSICKLQHLQYLNLANNHLKGEFPQCIGMAERRGDEEKHHVIYTLDTPWKINTTVCMPALSLNYLYAMLTACASIFCCPLYCSFCESIYVVSSIN